MSLFDPELQKKILTDQRVRQELTRKSHFIFFHVYLPHYVLYPTAPFQREIFQLTEDQSKRTVAIVSFRSSAKSTIANHSLPIWAIIGAQQKKYVLILGQTQQQAQQHLKNIKEELMRNKLLRQDLGPFYEDNEWRAYSIVIPKYGARISAASTEQSIRGMIHAQYRPDLIIGDDLEDLASVKTRESRDKTHQWLTSEVIPAGDRGTRLIIIGNLLHEDSLLMRVKRDIEEKRLDEEFRAYPLIDDKGNCLWPGKYPDKAAIEAEKQRVGNENAFRREYLLQIVSDQAQLIHPNWIYEYDVPPKRNAESQYRYTAIGIDLAISKSDSADFTAMVAASVYGYGNEMKIYILPNPVNERLSYMETQEQVKIFSKTVGDERPAQIFVEDVGYQASLIEQLEHDGFPAEGFKTLNQDKRARLALTTHLIQNGTIRFPKRGAEKLRQQLTGFENERHDDLADAFSILVLKIMEDRGSQPFPYVEPSPSPWGGDLRTMKF